MGHTTVLPELQDFPELICQYWWDDHHAAFGWPPDSLDKGFPWIVALEDKFRASIEQNLLPPIDLAIELILWGGNQQNVLGKFSRALRQMRYETFMHRVIANLDDPPLALESATAIKGFGLTYGSKLLRFCRPRDYGALDGRIGTALESELGVISSSGPKMRRQYAQFLEILHDYRRGLQESKVLRPAYGSRAATIQWSAAEVEMALFVWAFS